MKILLTLFVLFFSSSLIAEDISDFQIEGMGVGDSLLDYFSEEEIKEKLIHAKSMKDKFLILNFYQNPKFELYENVLITIKKNDKNHIIYALRGVLYFKNNIEDCYKKKKQIVSDLSSLYSDSVKKVTIDKPHEIDKSGQSKVSLIEFWFNSGDLSRVYCEDWSKEFEKKNYWDSLYVVLNLKEYADFLMYEYYD